MRDYWNDPPESPEPPSCPNDKYYDRGNTSGFCPGSVEYLYDGKTGSVWSCDTCAYQWVIPFPVDPEPPKEIEPTEEVEPSDCPHGNTGQCDACDYLADFAYDAERERRYFGR